MLFHVGLVFAVVGGLCSTLAFILKNRKIETPTLSSRLYIAGYMCMTASIGIFILRGFLT